MSRAFHSSLRAFSSALAIAAIAVLAACGPNTEAPKQCGTGQVLCNGQCVDLANDSANCGFCGNTCVAPGNGGSTACVSGECAPTCSGGGLKLCNAEPADDGGLVALSCTDTDVDPSHCGSCDTVCGPNQNCTNGQCTGCPSGMLRCPGGAGMPDVCLAILSDNENCGGCGTACNSGTYCDNGACVALGNNNCGNPDGGVASQTDLQTDRYNCGQCGVVCANDETCTSGRCEACTLAQCGNACTDTTSDPSNCGGCGVACSGGQVCVDSACGPGVRVEMLGPADGGFVEPNSYFYQLIQTESALPIATLTVQGPLFGAQADGGPITSANAAYVGALPQGAGSKIGTWEIGIPAQNPDAGWNGIITATAYDTGWSSAGSSAPQHLGSAAAIVHYAGAIDGGYVPRLTLSANGLALDAGAFIPLGAQTITLSTQAPDPASNIGNVEFYMVNGNRTLDLGTAQRTGGSEVLEVDADQMLLGNSTIEAYAYAQDNSTVENVSPPVTVVVGAIATANSGPPQILIDDAGTPSLWWMGATPGAAGASGSTGASVVSAPYGLVSPSVPDAGVLDAGFFPDTLIGSPDLGGLYAVTTAGEIVHFQCQSGFNCVQRNYVIGVQAQSILSVTSTSLAIADHNNKLWFAPSASGTAVSAGGTNLNNINQLQDGTLIAVAGGPNTTRNGDVPANQQQIVAYSPAIGLVNVGSPMASLQSLYVYPGGELAWVEQDQTGKYLLHAAALVNGQVHAATAVQVGQSYADWTANPRPGFITGLTVPDQALSDGGVASLPLTVFVADTTQGSISFPIPAANPQSGPVEAPYTNGNSTAGVGSRTGYPTPFAFSDDQLKEIAVSADPAPAPDGGTETDFTLWLIDLPSHAATAVYSTPRLLPFAAPDFYTECSTGAQTSQAISPHFVHSAAGAVLAGGAPDGGVAPVPALVFDELLDPPATNGTGPSTYPVRLYAARYGTGATPSQAEAVDRFAALTVGSVNNNACDLLAEGGTLFSQPFPLLTSTPFETETTAGGGAFLFIGSGAGSDTTLYSAPLFGSGPLASARVLDSATDFRTREDTGRMLALRADGNLYAGQLGQAPSLSLVLTGGNGGAPPLGLGTQPGFGFTPDGNHAWMSVQNSGLENTIGGAQASGILQEVDLASGQRTDFGSLAYGARNLFLPVTFLAGGTTAFGVDPVLMNGANGSDAVELWGALSANGQGTHHYETGNFESVLDANNNSEGSQGTAWLGIFESTVDGNEGRLLLQPAYYADWSFGPANPPRRNPARATPDGEPGFGTYESGDVAFAAKDGTLYNGALTQSWPTYQTNFVSFATWSPYGGPFAPDYEMFQTNGLQAVLAARAHPDGASSISAYQYWFKQWSSAASGGLHPARLLATGADYLATWIISPDQSRLAPIFAVNSTYAAAYKGMAAHPWVLQPLP